MAKHHFILSIVVALIFTMTTLSLTDVPKHISFQGKLHDDSGNPLTGQYEVTFHIYTTQTGGTALWSETLTVNCENGLYSVILGKTSSITLDFDGQYYLGVQVTGDSELSPRHELTSVPGAFRAAVADDADKVDGKDADEFADSDHQHDDRYYTETELKTSDGNPPNEGSNRMSWNNLTDVPAGFADGTDEVGTTGEGISQINEGTGITVTNPTGPTATVAADIGTGADQVAAGDHTHHSLDAADSNPTNAVYVDNDGNVGIGTTSPDVNLHVQGSEFDKIKVESTVSWGNATLIAKTSGGMHDYLQLYKGGPTTSGSTAGGIPLANLASLTTGVGAGPLMLEVMTSNPMYFVTDSEERMRITSDGNLGIGTTSPTEKLQVAGNVKVDDTLLASNVSSNSPLRLQTAGTTRMYIDDASGNIGIGTTNPNGNLHIKSTEHASLRLESGSGKVGTIHFYVAGGGPLGSISYRADADPQYLSINTPGTPHIVLQANAGNVGIGTANPTEELDVDGTAQMTGFKMPTGASDGYVLTSDGSGVGTWQAANGGNGGIGGSGTDNFLSRWNGTSNLENSIVYQSDTGNIGIGTTAPGAILDVMSGSDYMQVYKTMSYPFTFGFGGNDRARIRVQDETLGAHAGQNFMQLLTVNPSGAGVANISMISDGVTLFPAGNVGIGVDNPADKLDVDGTVQMTGFKMPTGASNGYVLTSDGSGVGTWQAANGGGIGGSGTDNYLPRWNGTSTLENSTVYQSDTGYIGIGTTSPDANLHVDGGVSTYGIKAEGATSYPIHSTWGGSGLGSAILAKNTGSSGDALQVIAEGSGRSGLWARGSSGVDYAIYGKANGATWAGYFEGDLYAGGNVGFGTTDPGDRRLHVTSSEPGVEGATAFIENTNSNGVAMIVEATSNDLALLVSQKGGGDIFRCDSYTGGWHEVFVVDNDGKVGIGQDPEHMLHVEGQEDGEASFGDAVGHFKNTATTEDAAGVYGECANSDYYGFGGFFQGGYTGVYARVSPTGSNGYYGVYGHAEGGSGTNHGVYGYAAGSGTNWAGYFDGDVSVTGDMNPAAAFCKIDHPLDPENKYLSHSFVESPDMMNVYNGNVTLNVRGEAIVQLPDYVEAFNRDFRYQLTAIGAPGPNLYVAQKISGNRFKIGGGKAGMEVSWQVTGIRQDAYANAHPIRVEKEKSVEERGKYLHPEEYGQPETKGIDYAHRMKKEVR